LQRAWNKYGEQSFTYEILEETDDVLNREQYWLDYYKRSGVKLYNIAVKAGHPTMGRKLSFETRMRMSVGYPELVNEETGEIIPGGQSINQFCIEKDLNTTVMAAVVRGVKRAYKGWTVLGKKPKKNVISYPMLINRKTGEIIQAGLNLNKLCNQHGLDPGTMSKVLSGNRKQHKGWTVAKVTCSV
jgi:hypothetical protein